MLVKLTQDEIEAMKQEAKKEKGYRPKRRCPVCGEEWGYLPPIHPEDGDGEWADSCRKCGYEFDLSTVMVSFLLTKFSPFSSVLAMIRVEGTFCGCERLPVPILPCCRFLDLSVRNEDGGQAVCKRPDAPAILKEPTEDYFERSAACLKGKE